jgi:hypothetical protein
MLQLEAMREEIMPSALERLPATHAEALRLREHGETDEAIAAQLGIEREAVEPLVRVAEAKLAARVDSESP